MDKRNETAACSYSLNSTSNTENVGLFLCGNIIDRVKKNVQLPDRVIEVVTYTVDIHSRRYFVDDYDPESYLSKGEFVSLPVYVKPYRKKNGDITFMLKIQKNVTVSNQGEHF